MVKYFLLILTIMIFGVPLSAQSGDNPDALIARVWLERASVLLNQGYPVSRESLQQAAEALDIASEYQSFPGRDALYLQARLILLDKSDNSGESSVRRAYSLLSESLSDNSKGRFSDITSFEDRAVLWSSLALQLRDYRGLLVEYDKWPRGNRNNPLLLYAAARAALYLGLNREAAELAETGETLSLPSTDLRMLNPSFPAGAEPGFRAISITAGDPRSISTLGAAWKRWPGTLEDAIRPWLLSGYLDVERTDGLAELLSPEMQNLILLSRRPGNADLGLLQMYNADLALMRRIRQIDPQVGASLIDSLLSGFTGVLESDADYDGYPEEKVNFVNGKPASRVIDMDQDGVFEWYITYENSRPWQIRFITENGKLVLTYDEADYPSLLQVDYQENNVTVHLSLNPGAYSWEAEGKEGFWNQPRRPLEPEWSEKQLWAGTRLVTFSAAVSHLDSFSVSETYLAGGLPVRAVEKTYSDRDMNTLLWIREIIYDGGVPVAGRRSYRVDDERPGRRLWELYERYENGKMVGLAWDPGMRGSTVYLRDWALERYLEVQLWDTDFDGWIDVRRFLLPDGVAKSRELLIGEAGPEDLLPWNAADWSPWE